jgi:AraC family transcriptional regulator
MGATIPDGQYYGEVTRTQRVADLVLSETRYAPGAVVPRHAHASPLLCLVLSGAFVEQSRGTTRTLGPGCVLFHPENEPHAHRFEAGRTRCFSIQLGAGWLCAVPQERFSLGGPREAPRGPLAWFARQLHAEFIRGSDASPLVIEGLALAVLGELGRAPVQGTPARADWVSRARDLLEARLREPPRLTELAAQLGVNPAHLSRTFRQRYGVGPAGYVARRRVERACTALVNPELSLAQLAHDLGFADQSHLCRSFRRVTGLTPGAWRRRR